MTSSARVLIVDDRPVMRRGIRSILTEEPSIQVVAEANSLFSAIEQITDRPIDVVLMDIGIPGGSPSVAAVRLRQRNPGLKVLFLLDRDHECHDAEIPPGADGYLANSTPPQQLIEAVLRLWQGGQSLDSSSLESLLKRYEAGDRELIRLKLGLTDNEIALLKQVAAGATNKEIAAELYLSEITVIRRIERAVAKLGSANKAQAVAVLARMGVI